MNKSLLRIGLAILFFLIFFRVTATLLDPDLGWHLRVGKDILDTRSAPHFDTFSYTMPGHEWVDHEWLTDAALAFLEEHDLWLLAIIIFTLLAAGPFLVWLWRMETDLGFLLLTLTAFMMVNYAGVRPHLITFFLSFVLLEVLLARFVFRRDQIFTRLSFWGLPVMFGVWANLHGGFFLGLFIFGIFVVLSQFQEETRRTWFKDVLVFAASIALTFVNPYGWRIYEEIFRVLLSADTAVYIAEWQSALVHPALKASDAAAVFLFLAIAVFLAFFLFLAWRYRKKHSLPVLTISFIFFLGYLKSLKLGPIFFASAWPIFPSGLFFLREEILRSRQGHPFSLRETRAVKWTKMIAILFLLSFGLVLVFPSRSKHEYPEKAITFLQQFEPEQAIGNLFNHYGWGGYLIWYLPAVKVFIDGRMPHWVDRGGYSAMAEYAEVFYPKKGQASHWKEVFNKRQIRTVLIPTPWCGTSSPLPIVGLFVNFYHKASIPCELVAGLRDEGWRIIYQDQTAMVLNK